MTEKKYLDGFINADDEVNSLRPNEILLSENMRFGSTENGATGRWENVLSNSEIANAHLPAGTNTIIGQKADDSGRFIVFFNHNSNGDHGIFLYYKANNTFYRVLRNDDVTGGLNFSTSNLINHIAIVEGMVYWTDANTEPCKLNLWAGIATIGTTPPVTNEFVYQIPIDPYEITLIRRSAQWPLSADKQEDSGFETNFIFNEAFHFATQYQYWDGERSVLSSFSSVVRMNKEDDDYNFIRITLSNNEIIPPSARAVRLCVRKGSTGGWSVIKTWDKKVTDDNTEISQHNLGVQALSYDFYNNRTGETIDSVTAATPFHYVPSYKASTLEIIKNRLFLGGNDDGYNTPITTSLALTPSTVEPGEADIPIYLVNFQYDLEDVGGDTRYYAAYAVNYLVNGVSGWYEIFGTGVMDTSAFPTLPSPPATIAVGDLIYMGVAIGNYTHSVLVREGLDSTHNGVYFPPTLEGTDISVTGISTAAQYYFKAASTYLAGVLFFDRAQRRCGVVTNEGLIFETPYRDYDYSNGIQAINWTLNNNDATVQIPDWAWFYTPVITKNQRTRFFIQSYDYETIYVTKAITGENEYNVLTKTYSDTRVAIALNTRTLLRTKIGYNFTEGDLCIVTREDDTTFEIPVIGQEDGWILLKPEDIGDLTGVGIIYEIYTPFQPSEQEPFYETGAMYKILLPGQAGRVYETLSGIISPDTVVLARKGADGFDFYGEAMSPNDKYYQRWDTDHGRANLVTLLGRKFNKTSVRYSTTIISGTETNGLSEFLPLNQELLPLEMGTLQRMIATSKVQGEGSVLVVIGSTETASLYIGEAQISDANNNTFFVKSEGVIGQVNVFKGNYGTLNPESVVGFKGNIYWLDILSGRFLQYSINGVDDISEGDGSFKFSRVSNLLSKKYLSLSAAEIITLGSRPFIFGGVDPHHKEIYWTIPKLGGVPKPVLDDYSTLPAYLDSNEYPYDILDFKAKTLVYKLSRSRWMGSFSWTPEGHVFLDSDTYSFKAGKLYKHNIAGSYNVFYGINCKPRIAFVCNLDNTIKEFQSIALESSLPEWVHFRAELPNIQSSDLVATDFSDKEGVYYAPIFKDRLSPNVSGLAELKMIKGDVMRTKALMILVQFNSINELKYFRLATIGFNQSSGQY